VTCGGALGGGAGRKRRHSPFLKITLESWTWRKIKIPREKEGISPATKVKRERSDQESDKGGGEGTEGEGSQRAGLLRLLSCSRGGQGREGRDPKEIDQERTRKDSQL